jgi:hypothetical protein
MHPGEPINDQWASWLAMDAPRRVSPATIREYCRHLARFASNLRDAPALELLAYSGMRAHEGTAIHMEDLEVGRRQHGYASSGSSVAEARLDSPPVATRLSESGA